MIKQIWGEVFLYARWSRELRFWLEEPSHQPGYFLWTPYCSLPPTLGEQHPYGEILWFVCRRLARAFCLVVTVVDIVDVVCYFVPKKKKLLQQLASATKNVLFLLFHLLNFRNLLLHEAHTFLSIFRRLFISFINV